MSLYASHWSPPTFTLEKRTPDGKWTVHTYKGTPYSFTTRRAAERALEEAMKLGTFRIVQKEETP